jgi:hypothetical protein
MALTQKEKKIKLADKEPDVKIDQVEPHSRHDDPYPKVFGEDAASSHELNEAVLNHLPLNEEQKKTLIAQLMADQLKQPKPKEEIPRVKVLRVRKNDKGEREPVKSLTK